MRYPSTFGDLFGVFRDFDNLFGDVFPEYGSGTSAGTRLLPTGRSGARAPAITAGRSWRPAVDYFVKDGDVVLRMELPGVDPNDMNVSVAGDHLTISGEKKWSREVNDPDFRFSESSYGRFERAFRLPEGVTSDTVKARYENGVLELTVPTPEKEKPKSVRIEIGTDPKKIKAA